MQSKLDLVRVCVCVCVWWLLTQAEGGIMGERMSISDSSGHLRSLIPTAHCSDREAPQTEPTHYLVPAPSVFPKSPVCRLNPQEQAQPCWQAEWFMRREGSSDSMVAESQGIGLGLRPGNGKPETRRERKSMISILRG
ncbi:hypothetical protein IWX47DRAFT_340583 [Phyllosticta citricarpa]